MEIQRSTFNACLFPCRGDRRALTHYELRLPEKGQPEAEVEGVVGLHREATWRFKYSTSTFNPMPGSDSLTGSAPALEGPA